MISSVGWALISGFVIEEDFDYGGKTNRELSCSLSGSCDMFAVFA